MKRRSKYEGLQKRKAIAGYLFILPFIIGFLAFMVKPFFQSLYMGFCDVQVGPGGFTNVYWGLKNYVEAFTVDLTFTRLLTEELSRMAINVPAIIFMALTWRTGHLQACTFAFILVACVWVSEIWKKNNAWPAWGTIQKTTASFLLTGVLGAVLSMDVFVDTLQRMGGCKELPFGWGINNIPTYCTLLFPTSLGIPETLDLALQERI